LARLARLFVGSDTGPLHLAAAVGTPCVGLYGPWPAYRHGPYGPQHVVVQKMLFEGSTRCRRKAPPIYMEAIDVASVCDACDQILRRDGNIKNRLPATPMVSPAVADYRSHLPGPAKTGLRPA